MLDYTLCIIYGNTRRRKEVRFCQIGLSSPDASNTNDSDIQQCDVAKKTLIPTLTHGNTPCRVVGNRRRPHDYSEMVCMRS
ncbi:hypothetical protein PoB_001303500 [Plakobranchus ocellatus]|uniref:Uncharacterized protein n=1 Tax=Plakobranchus ocellatus TaxID=259542 RepID=A0AAV3YVQ3_9GAST|nr:hypothetical protein PoB_001303500 [Plakobranchus ocellatus]